MGFQGLEQEGIGLHLSTYWMEQGLAPCLSGSLGEEQHDLDGKPGIGSVAATAKLHATAALISWQQQGRNTDPPAPLPKLLLSQPPSLGYRDMERGRLCF